MRRPIPVLLVLSPLFLPCCSETSLPGGGDGGDGGRDLQRWESAPPPTDGVSIPREAAPLPATSCTKGAGSATVAAPRLSFTFKDSWHESWLSSPAVIDLDGDGAKEIVVARASRLLVWDAQGSIRFKIDVNGRIWSSPVVTDLVADRPGLEIAAAARSQIHAWDAQGQPLAGFPVTFRDEMRALAAADIDGDGQLELVAVSTVPLSQGGKKDIVMAYKMDGSVAPGFPPNTTGVSGCDAHCYVTGGFDQTLALGDLDGDDRADILIPQDNAYISLHTGAGVAFDVASIFEGRKKFAGIRFLLDYALAQQGWPDNEPVDLQAHFTNSAPALADLDGDGQRELIVLSSVQNAAQTEVTQGVALWVLRPDGTRPTPWEAPFHAPGYLAGLFDFEGTNVVAATNQVAVADLDPAIAGPEMVFAGFDGRIHCVDAQKTERWSTVYTEDPRVLTGGVVIADLSGDGSPEIAFASYSPDEDKSHLFILDAAGNILHQVPLPKRGAMAVPTIADIEGDGRLEIVINLKDAEDKVREVVAYTVDTAEPNCLLWPTGRGNLQRTGALP